MGKPQPHDRAWKVLDKRLLVEEVIPKFFGQSKYPSFTRQLSGWGFKRLLKGGPDFGCYYHECFLRGHPRLTILMRRNSPGKGRAVVNTIAEPDLYTISKQCPLHVGEKPVYLSTETNAREASASQRDATTGSLPGYSLTSTAVSNLQGEIASNQTHVVKNGNQYTMSKAEDETERMHTTMMYRHYPDSLARPYSDSLARPYSESLAPTTLLNLQGEMSANQTHAKNGNQYNMSKAEDETTGRMPTTMYRHNYPGATGNLYRNVEAHGRSQGSHSPTRNVHQQRYEGYHAQRPHPYHLQSRSHDDLLMFNQKNGNINPYSQLRPDSINGIHRQRGQDQPMQRVSAAAITRPSGSSQNPWFVTAATEDSLNQMPMNIPEQGFDFNASSFEDSFHASPMDPTTSFSEYNRTA